MKHLHDYKIIIDNAEVIVEYCQECKKKLITRKDKNGRIDNNKYKEEHKRDFLQRGDKLYLKYYGNN